MLSTPANTREGNARTICVHFRAVRWLGKLLVWEKMNVGIQLFLDLGLVDRVPRVDRIVQYEVHLSLRKV